MSNMVEVRAIVRLEMLDRVVRTLKDSGVPRLTVARVHAIGAGVDPACQKFSLEEGSAYADKALVQFICGGDRCYVHGVDKQRRPNGETWRWYRVAASRGRRHEDPDTLPVSTRVQAIPPPGLAKR